MQKNHCDICDAVLERGSAHAQNLYGVFRGKSLIMRTIVFYERYTDQGPIDICQGCLDGFRAHRGIRVQASESATPVDAVDPVGEKVTG